MRTAPGLPVVVVGGSLAGMAAAARLAKNRHDVIMVDAADRLGGRFATRSAHDLQVDALPGMITFPAPWRDLFRKSGREFDTTMTRAGLALVPAPPTRHQFDDGTELVLAANRGVQLAQLTQAYGRPVAERWRDLVDHLDDVWQALRPLGSEDDLTSPEMITSSRLHALIAPGRTVEQLAREMEEPHLADIIRSVAWRLGSEPRRTPAWCVVQLSVERTFGRWLMQRDGVPTRTGELVDALTSRLELRRVEVRLATTVNRIATDRHGVHTVDTTGGRLHAAAVVCATNPWTYADLARDRRALRAIRPARAAQVTHELVGEPCPEPAETIRHTTAGPVVRWTRPVGGSTMISSHDWPAGAPDRGAGIAWRGERTWLRMPSIRTRAPGRYLVGPHSRGGAGLSATVLSGALASYACHDDLSTS